MHTCLFSAGEAQTLSATNLFIGGVNPANIPASFPADARTSLRGCFEGLRFITYSIAPEPPELIDFDSQIRDERLVLICMLV